MEYGVDQAIAPARTPWPTVMKALFIGSWMLVGGALVAGVGSIMMYASVIVATPPNLDTMAPLLLVLVVPLFVFAAIAGIATGLLLTRKPWSRIVYTVLFALLGLANLAGVFLSPTLALPCLIMVAAIIVIWLPASRSFFTPDSAPFYQVAPTPVDYAEIIR
ncbi:MAG: hypothetical protein LBE83_01875 [Propionibacteriaceae bacterium]|jgi:hypothetical protein|nr:hypothetical protein [Propionibacteriaceae bacterium]